MNQWKNLQWWSSKRIFQLMLFSQSFKYLPVIWDRFNSFLDYREMLPGALDFLLTESNVYPVHPDQGQYSAQFRHQGGGKQQLTPANLRQVGCFFPRNNSSGRHWDTFSQTLYTFYRSGWQGKVSMFPHLLYIPWIQSLRNYYAALYTRWLWIKNCNKAVGIWPKLHNLNPIISPKFSLCFHQT